MISKDYLEIGNKSSAIREMFDLALERSKEVGPENVYNFCIGNPNVPTPDCVKEELIRLLNTEDCMHLHGYTTSAGDEEARDEIARGLNKRYGTHFTRDNLYFTVGAACALNVCFRALCNHGDEFIAIAPYFPEYRFYLEAIGVTFVPVMASPEDFQIHLEALEEAITEKTKGIILNSPNNPSGAVYSKETLQAVSDLLRRKEKEYGHAIYIVADEPYREIAYGVDVPYIPNYYRNTLVCYSYSKCLSIPGERMGYLVIPKEVDDFADLSKAVSGAARILGYVNAPTIFQLLMKTCHESVADMSIYRRNRDLFYEALRNMGFSCVKPDGAFYLFPKSLEEDDYAFCRKAAQHNIMMVPGSEFGYPGHVRISYCVSTEQIKQALPAFEKFAEQYKR
ncbi:MAG: pyridoxal phosphate-dependent aminotransferase [Eubacterium sp.]|nr:pyridoxal phosphate-dependent aminotransferase [Eubacterium sp.]